MLHKLKQTIYNTMMKIDKQDLIGIIDTKYSATGISDKNGFTNMSYILSKKCSVRKCNSIIIFLIGINKICLIEFCFKIMFLPEGNT